jgi:Skp family chaperone for outer membrane proteins
MKGRTLAVVVLSVFLAVLSIIVGRRSRVFRGSSSVGYVSMQRILSESPEAKATVTKLQELQQQQKTRELGAMQQAAEGTRAQLRGGALASAVRTRLEQQAQQQQALERATAEA